MKKIIFRTKRKAMSGVGVVLSMFLIITLLAGAAMPPGGAAFGTGAGSAAVGADAGDFETDEGTADSDAAIGGLATMASGAASLRMPDSMKSILEDARASFDEARASLEAARDEEPAGGADGADGADEADDPEGDEAIDDSDDPDGVYDGPDYSDDSDGHDDGYDPCAQVSIEDIIDDIDGVDSIDEFIDIRDIVDIDDNGDIVLSGNDAPAMPGSGGADGSGGASGPDGTGDSSGQPGESGSGNDMTGGAGSFDNDPAGNGLDPAGSNLGPAGSGSDPSSGETSSPNGNLSPAEGVDPVGGDLDTTDGNSDPPGSINPPGGDLNPTGGLDPAGGETASPGSGMNAMAIKPKQGVYIDLVDFSTVKQVREIIAYAFDYIERYKELNYLLVVNSGAPFNAGTGTLLIDIPDNTILLWAAAYTGSTSSSNARSLIETVEDWEDWGNGEFVIVSGGSISYHGKGVAIYSYGSRVYLEGGSVNATNSKGTAIETSTVYVSKGTVSAPAGTAVDGDAYMSGGTVSTKTGIAIDGWADMYGGTVSATTGTAVKGRAEISRGTIKATSGIAVDGDADIYGGTIKATSGTAIRASDANARVYGGKVTTETGSAIVSVGTRQALVQGGTVSATGKSKGTAITGETGKITVSGGKVTAKAGYAISSAGDIEISGGTVTGVSSSNGDITLSNWSIVDGINALNGKAKVTDSLVAVKKGPAIKASSDVEISGSSLVMTDDSANAAIVAGGDAAVSGGQTIAFGANADAINAGGDVTVSSGMVAAARAGTGIRNQADVAVSEGMVLSVAGVAIEAEGASSTVNVSGGVVNSYTGGYGIKASGNAIIIGGSVGSDAGIAIYGGKSGGTLDITGGFVYVGSGKLADAIDWGDDHYNDNLSGEGIVCAWEKGIWDTSFLVGETAGLIYEPSDATVFWDKEDWGYMCFGLHYEKGLNAGFHEVLGAMVFDTGVEKGALSISPNHTILTSSGDEVELWATLNVEGAVGSDINWSAAPVGIVGFNGTSDQTATGASVVVKAIDMATAEPATVQIRAEYDNDGFLYSAAATIEILPGGVELDPAMTIRLLEKKATVNRAKTVGARVPILITKQQLSALGVQPPTRPTTGSLAVDKVELGTYNASKAWVKAAGYEARISPSDDRYIEISADLKTKSKKGVKVRLHRTGAPFDEAGWFEAQGSLDLTTVTKYPKVTLKTSGSLNIKFPGNAVALTAASNDGLVTPVSIVNTKAADSGKLYLQNGEIKLGYMTKAATVKTRVEVAVAGYKPIPQNKWPKLNVKVANALPKLKLSMKSVTFYDDYYFYGSVNGAPFDSDENQPVQIKLDSADRKWRFEDGYTVTGVESSWYNAKGKELKNSTVVEIVSHADGVILIKPDYDETGNTSIVIKIEDGLLNTYKIYLPLKVNIKWKLSQISLKASPKAATVNTGHPKDTGLPDDEDLDFDVYPALAEKAKIVDIQIAPNTKNLVLNDWEITAVKEGTKNLGAGFLGSLKEAIWVKPSANKLTLLVKNKEKLAQLAKPGGDRKLVLTIKAPNKVPGKSVSFTLTISDKAPTFSTKAGKAKIDIAKQGSFMDVTVTLKNAASDIDEVTLWDVPTDGSPPIPHADFEVLPGSLIGKKFKIVPSHLEVLPNVARKIGVELTLKNGDVLKSWEVVGGKPIGNPITVKPIQTLPKATLSSKSVTLYKGTPLTGQTVEIGFAKPETYKLGAVQIAPDSLKAFRFAKPIDDGFGGVAYEQVDGLVLEQSGEGKWTIFFEDGHAPAKILDLNYKTNKKTTNLKASYNIKVQLWAEGTYRLEDDGADNMVPKALGTGKNASKPRVVTIKVNMKALP